MDRGILFALLTALISGISVFVNGFAVTLTDPSLYALLKNAGALMFLASSVFLFKEFHLFRKLSKKDLLYLVMIGVVGGSIPFLLFFEGLSLGGPAASSFVYRSIFIFAGIFGYFLLREKPEKNDLIAGAAILAGNFLLVNDLSFGTGQLLVLAATVLWALEYTISRKILKQLEPKVVMFSRMFFGSIVGPYWRMYSLTRF